MMYEDAPGWEIWIPEDFARGLGIEQIYEELSKPVVRALRELGVEAKFRPKNVSRFPGGRSRGWACTGRPAE